MINNKQCFQKIIWKSLVLGIYFWVEINFRLIDCFEWLWIKKASNFSWSQKFTRWEVALPLLGDSLQIYSWPRHCPVQLATHLLSFVLFTFSFLGQPNDKMGRTVRWCYPQHWGISMEALSVSQVWSFVAGCEIGLDNISSPFKLDLILWVSLLPFMSSVSHP